MKNPKRPTAAQRNAMLYAGCNPSKWLVTKAAGDILTLVHRETGRIKEIPKEV